MAKMQITKGKTSKLVQVFIQDSSQSDGSGLTGLLFNSSGLTATYYRETAATTVPFSLVTMTAGTWASGGFIEIDATSMPGWYQLGVPNAALVTGAEAVIFHLFGATNMVPLPLEIELTSTDVQNGTSFNVSRIDENISAAKTLTVSERNSVADAYLDRSAGVESGLTPRQQMRLAIAALLGLASGFPSSNPKVFTSADVTGGTTIAGTKNRVSATTDTSGNRSAITVDLTT